MNSKTVLAFLVALAMVTPIAAFAAPSSDAADEPADLGVKAGDAWGAQMEILEEAEALEYLSASVYNITGGEIDVSDIDEEIVNKLVQNIDIRGALIGEVVRADDTGYTVRTDGGFSLVIAVGYDGTVSGLIGERLIPGVDGNTRLVFNVTAAAAVVSSGVINFDSESKITSADLSADAVVRVTVNTNVDLTAVSSSDPSSFFAAIGEDMNESSLTAGASLLLSYAPAPEAEIGITATSIENGTSYELAFGGKFSYNYSVYVSADGFFAGLTSEAAGEILPPAVGEAVPESFFDAGEDGTIQSGFSGGTTVTSPGMPYTVIFEKYGEPDEDGMQEYTLDVIFRGRDLLVTTVKLIPGSLPGSFSLNEIEVDRESAVFLGEEQKNTVRSVFGEIQRTFGEQTSGISFTVTFLDEEGKEMGTETVGYGGTVSPLPYDDKTDADGKVTEKFVGWETAEGLKWNFGWGVKSDLTLVPAFANSFGNAEQVRTHMMSGPGMSAYMKASVKNIGDFDGSSFDYDFDGTLVVDVCDDDGRFMYRWTIENDGGAVPAGTQMNLKVETKTNAGIADLLTDVSYTGEPMRISFDASGTMPGRTTINYSVDGSFADGAKIQIMYVVQDENGDAVALEPVGTSAVSGGTVSFELAHCSDYVLFEIPAPAQGDDSGSMMLYAGLAIAAVVIVIAAAVILHRRHAA